jgi:glycosidase
MTLRANPSIFEINTWVWLTELSDKCQRIIDLSSVPPSAWDEIAQYHFDAVWLMGVWRRSPAGREVANGNAGLVQDFQRALPDYTPDDNVGSPYCVREYSVDEHLGGPAGLQIARRELKQRGMALILDFVPNHLAPDHPWTASHPQYFVQGTEEDLAREPNSYMQASGRILACGKDPYFPPWADVVQLNTFNPELRAAATQTVLDIASQCDGVRCDMAMLMFNRIFENTWHGKVGPAPAAEYWVDLIRTVKSSNRDFLFMAEAYWDLEWELQQQGFDYCYDKRLYDRLLHDTEESVRLHLAADLSYQSKLVRFTENHDEPRIASLVAEEREMAIALLSATLPGAKLFHEGQFEGRKVKVPVFLRRRVAEAPNQKLREFYEKLLRLIDHPLFHGGEWHFEQTGWRWTLNADSLRVDFPSGRVWVSRNGASEAELTLR